MTVILHLDASARTFDKARPNRNSISRGLAYKFRELWAMKTASHTVAYRDLGVNPPDFINEAWVSAAFTPEQQRTIAQKNLLSISDKLIDEVDRADIILLSTPMYNYGMPAALKAWFDQVIRVNKTFTFDLNRGDFPLKPIFSGKTMIVVASCGEFGFHIGGIREKMNHLGPHIKVVSQYLGIKDYYEICSEYQEFGDQRHKESLDNAYAEITNLVERLSRIEALNG